MTGISLDALNHDVLTYIFTTLSIPEIFLFRQVSRRLHLISEQHAVWRTVCTNEILRKGIPFPKYPLTSLSAKDLERQTLYAYRLGLNWISPTTTLHHIATSTSRVGAIEEIKFLSHRGKNWIVTTSLSIWWTLCIRDCESFQVVAQWSPGKTLFNGIAVNKDDQSDSAIAISVHRDGHLSVEILAISDDDAHGVVIETRRTLDTSSRPITLEGDLIALCDHDSDTLILNWKTEEQALLKSPETWQDKPLHVVFAAERILVARARSVCIFDKPKMASPGHDLDLALPCISKSFGWVDGVSLAPSQSALSSPPGSSHPPLSLLVRTKGHDPWTPTDQFRFMMLNIDFNHTESHASYDTSHEASLSPFDLITSLSSHHRGPLRCSDMVLGPCGTAVWVQPLDWAASGLIAVDNFVDYMPMPTSRERLVVALLPGLLSRGSPEAQVKAVLDNEGDGWTCLDYDEMRGLIALGSSSGEVTVYRL